MKEIYIKDLKKIKDEEIIETYGWIASKRVTKNYLFLDVVDSTGSIQCIGSIKNFNPSSFKIEQSVKIKGSIKTNPNNQQKELYLNSIDIIGEVERELSPSPRTPFNTFDLKYTNYVQENRHLFIRNPQVMAALKARHLVLGAIHKWFRENDFIEITAPILTPVLLYDEDTGISVNVNNQDVFLTQCVGFYLESAVHAFEKVYNIGPSFRGKESISKRHLTEYWHVKAEMAFCTFDEFFSIVESLISFIVKEVQSYSKEICKDLKTKGFCDDGIKIPFPRITYKEACQLLKENGYDVEYGKSINDIGEKFLSDYFNSPVWIVYNARNIEGFPYKIKDNDLTYTADLIASNGYGEILGIADKITDVEELEMRLEEKGKNENSQYEWFKELRTFGTVPHCGMGMGVERIIRWLFQLPHVREAMPFPRSMGRKIYP